MILFTRGSLISISAVLPECPAIIITQAIVRYLFTAAWKVANLDLCLAKGH